MPNQIQQGADIFSNIEKTGEQFKQQFNELAVKAKKAIESNVNSMKFEASYALTVPKAQRVKTMNEVNEVRESLWNDALKKANGDTNKAISFYEELCDFP